MAISAEMADRQAPGAARALLSLDRERGFLARVGFLTNQPRTYGVTTRVDF